MVYYAYSSFIISTLFFVTLCSSSRAQTPAYRVHSREFSNNYAANSLFPANLSTTISSLYHNSNTHGFYNSSYGYGSEAAHSLFLCRGDISPQLCQSCIKYSSQSLLARCPHQKEAVIWYDECMLRYANRSIVSVLEEAPKWCAWNPNSNAYPADLIAIASVLISNLVNQAASTRNFYAAGDVNGTTIDNKIYGLVQCTPDISPNDCNLCLSGCVRNMPRCSFKMDGGRVLKPSCSIRYETYPFYAASPPALISPAPAQLSSPFYDASRPALISPAPAQLSSPFYDASRPALISPAPAQLSSPSPEFVQTTSTEHKQLSSAAIVAIIVVSVLVFVAIVSTLCYCFTLRKSEENFYAVEYDDGNEITSVQSLQVDLDEIRVATNNLSDENKIGQGGFGSVYKGIFANGQEIAVKRLSKSSSQGSEEFKNEVLLLARLQHKNLVRLIGFSLQGGEKLLIYELVPNKSLDYFLFDSEHQALLNWSIRYKIIGGIARGLLYLHEDSRLRIIHRDLKASNVLLDKDMIPKISDFGMAKIFGVDQSQGNTNRIAGTYGYMPPEYVIHGQFSVKSDVYSFGVLVLEILSGKKISSLDQEAGYNDNLPSFAWRQWRNGTAMEIVDPALGDSCSESDVMRCIQIGLSCVQDNPANRPTMNTVVLMFSSPLVTLPSPHQPAFFANRTKSIRIDSDQFELHQYQSKTPSSVSKLSITELHPR